MTFLGNVDLCEGMGSSEMGGNLRVVLRMVAGRGACSLMWACNHGEGPDV
jgi:hypothetical protein